MREVRNDRLSMPEVNSPSDASGLTTSDPCPEKTKEAPGM
jgi:hypothetical protein